MSDSHSHGRAVAGIGPGTRLNGIFEIDQRLAAGGMGEIYRGHAIETGDPVAIKVLRPDLVDHEAALALFRNEAKALYSIQHEAIVRYYVFSSDPGIRRHYLAMEFVDGEPLSDVLKRGPLSFEEVQALQQRVAAALHEAHRRGVIHRDVSPDNIIIQNGDVAGAKIIDFGIARLTKSTTIIGSGFAGNTTMSRLSNSAYSRATSRRNRTFTASASCLPNARWAGRSTWAAAIST
jgi:serine/threonine-protein kinase